MKKFRVMVLSALVFVIASNVLAQGNGNGNGGGGGRPSPSPTPTPAVISAQFVYCAVNDAICHAANRVRQDVNSPYVNGSQGVSIANTNGSSGDIVIYLDTSSSTRSVAYDLRELLYTGNPHPAWTTTPQNFKVQFVLHDANLLKTQGTCAGGAVTCEENRVSAMNGGFYIGKIRYRFQWNPGSVLPYINSGEPTSPVNINYRRDAAGQTWTVTPILQNGYYRAGMQVENKNQISFGGQYNMPFSLVVSVR